MKDLKCGLRECIHNHAYCCTAKTIKVNGKTDCITFQPSEDKRKNVFEAGEDFVPRDYTVDTQVKCDAKCVFNRSHVCYANGITVMGDHDAAAMCLTFINR